MPPAFVPHALLDRVEIMPLRSDDRLTITAHPGAERRWFQIRWMCQLLQDTYL
jgi:hypothetical protein